MSQEFTPEEVSEKKIYQTMGLSDEEYQEICDKLGRLPNYTETGIFSVMWSEHCCYKSTKNLLKKLPTEGKHLMIGPGEGGGVMDIGDDECVVFKIESHNHPSAIEPYQGAATGVGGILRDIFSMGAEPVALLNSLHFGGLQEKRTRYLFERVVEGIAGYGNCIGIPTVGGQVEFDETFKENPLVNVMCIGLAKHSEIKTSRAETVGSPVYYVGARTGRDGIHGATFASVELNEDSEQKRPSIQVGDPFTGKLLMEATQEICKSGAIEAVQDMGSAGLTCSITEMAHKGNRGMKIDLDAVPLQSENMSSYEIMLSESQERMLFVAKQGRGDELVHICKKWDLSCVCIGWLIEEERIVIEYRGEIVVDLPLKLVCDGTPLISFQSTLPPPRSFPKIYSTGHGKSISELFSDLVASLETSSRIWVSRQYDSTIGGRNCYLPQADAAVLFCDSGEKAVAAVLDCNSNAVDASPYYGAMMNVFESATNLSCVGATPLGITDGLNFGNPNNPEIYWKISRAIEGIRDACLALKIPVVGGNVSLYNESAGKSIRPAPIIGMIGLVKEPSKIPGIKFKEEGDIIFILGKTKGEHGVSAIQRMLDPEYEGTLAKIDPQVAVYLNETLRKLISSNLLASAHDLSEGGLSIALLESCTAELGCDIRIKSSAKAFDVLFSESVSRVLVSVRKEKEDRFIFLCREAGQSFAKIGNVSAKNYRVVINHDILISEPTQKLIRISEEVISQYF